MPAQAGIQYAVASRFFHWRLWNTGSPACAGDDTGCVFAFSRRIAPELYKYLSHPRSSEGAGNAGCALHPRSRVQNCRKLRTRAYRAAEAIRHSLRNGFTAYIVLSPVDGSFATVIGG